MIAEAHEIRENQSYRNISIANAAGAKQAVTEESVSIIFHLNTINIT